MRAAKECRRGTTRTLGRPPRSQEQKAAERGRRGCREFGTVSGNEDALNVLSKHMSGARVPHSNFCERRLGFSQKVFYRVFIGLNSVTPPRF